MLQCSITAPAGAPVAFELELGAGRFFALRYGPERGPLVLGVHGLSANARTFDDVSRALAADGHRVVALDLRGRGRSAAAGAGTFGWTAHARDVLDAATELGAASFDVVGHSMGAFIGMEIARLAPARVRRLVLVDAAGRPEPASLVPIAKGLERLGRTFADGDAYVAAVREQGVVSPWSPTWEAAYRHEIRPVEGGVAARTSLLAVSEDLAFGAKQDPRARWRELVMPTLLVRASVPIGGGFVLTESDRDDFVRTAPRATAIDVDANHYGVMTHPLTAQSIRRFLS
jgi:pimeloyl-ACP methyl ester carboxylesterase